MVCTDPADCLIAWSTEKDPMLGAIIGIHAGWESAQLSRKLGQLILHGDMSVTDSSASTQLSCDSLRDQDVCAHVRMHATPALRQWPKHAACLKRQKQCHAIGVNFCEAAPCQTHAPSKPQAAEQPHKHDETAPPPPAGRRAFSRPLGPPTAHPASSTSA